jgi:redox-regulated HSP33 family molecular chaperone
MLDSRSRSLIRALLYPVQFEREPEAGVARTFKRVVAAHALNASEYEYLAAIIAALESDEPLSELVPQSRPEETVRAYLASMQNEIIRSSEAVLAANE